MRGILGRDPGSEQGEDYESEDQYDTDCCQEIVTGGATERDGGRRQTKSLEVIRRDLRKRASPRSFSLGF